MALMSDKAMKADPILFSYFLGTYYPLSAKLWVELSQTQLVPAKNPYKLFVKILHRFSVV